MSTAQTSFAIGVTGTILFLAVAVLAAVAAGDSKWATSESTDSNIGLFRACGMSFGYPGKCVDIDEDNILFLAAVPSRYQRYNGIRALTILSCIFAGAGAFMSILIAVRSKRPSPQLAAAPIWAGLSVFVMGLLSLVMFASLKTDAFRFIPNLSYGPSFGCCIAFTVLALLTTIPFAVLTHLAWEDALLAARAGVPYSVALTPKARAAFVHVTGSP